MLAAGLKIGKSLAEPDLVGEAKVVIEAMAARGAEVPIPEDVVCAKAFSADAEATVKAATEVADDDLRAVLAIGGFAGLRSAEIERLEWADVDLDGGHITVTAGKAKTASRRIIPIADNLRAWLTPYKEQSGPVWPHRAREMYDARREVAARTATKKEKAAARAS